MKAIRNLRVKVYRLVEESNIYINILYYSTFPNKKKEQVINLLLSDSNKNQSYSNTAQSYNTIRTIDVNLPCILIVRAMPLIITDTVLMPISSLYAFIASTNAAVPLEFNFQATKAD